MRPVERISERSGPFMSLRCSCVLALALFMGLPVAQAQSGNRFDIRVGKGTVTGTEEYSIEPVKEGYLLTSQSNLTMSGAPVAFTQKQTLSADWKFIHYRLDVTAAGQPQIIEASNDGKQAQLHAEAGGQAKDQSVELHANLLVLDNLIASHFQILLKLLGPKPAPGSEWWILVPQRLAELRIKITVAGEDSAILNGKPVSARRYELEAGGLLEQFWAETKSNNLMRIFVPSQDVEIVREGFALAPVAQAEPSTPPCTERELTFPSDNLQVPATLCLPLTANGPVPLVVFVAGSGPNDRDETIGPNKPFRDIAWGLAERGIASLRYDKRTFAFRDHLDLATLDVAQEVLDDAVGGVRYALQLPQSPWHLSHLRFTIAD
jgi:hypothetical protein